MKRKSILHGFLVALFVAAGLFLTSDITYYADRNMIDPSYYEYTSNSIVGSWYDPKSGCFLLQTLDKKKTSDNYYQTRVVEFSRIRTDINPSNPNDAKYATDREATLDENDPHVYVQVESGRNKAKLLNGAYYDRQYVAFDRSLMPVEPRDVTLKDDNGNLVEYEYNTFILDQNKIFSAIERIHPDWHEEITKKQAQNIPVWFGLDSVMIAHYPSMSNANHTVEQPGGKKIDGWTGLAGNSSLYQTFGVGEFYRWSNWESMKNYFPNSLGSFSTGKGIYTHYNKYVCLSADVIPPTTTKPVTGVTDEIIGTEVIIKTYGDSNVELGTGHNQSQDYYSAPSMYTYNTSNEFNIGEAIPSTESYINGIDVSNWYGSVTVDLHRVTYKMTIPYTLVSATQGEKVQYVTVRTTEKVPEGVYDGLYYPSAYSDYDGTYYYYTCSYTTSDDSITYYSDTYSYNVTGFYYAINTINLYQHDTSRVINDFATVNYSGTTIPYTVIVNGQTVNSAYGNKFGTNSFVADTSQHVAVPTNLTATPVNIRVNDQITSYLDAYNYIGQVIAQRYANYGLITYNDTLSLNNVTYMDANGKYYQTFNNRLYIGEAANDKQNSQKVVTIPAQTQNGDYYTTLRVDYKSMVAGDKAFMIRFNGSDAGEPGIKPGYKQNEPIKVHTPVISPISIKGEDATQLVDGLQTQDTQLILDNTYTLSFDWYKYFHYKGYEQHNFKQYVMFKEIRFPFDVIIDGTTYNRDNATGYTQWIDVGNVESVKFYLPSWSQEGIYGSHYITDYEYYTDKRVEARVYAVNYIADEREKWQAAANTNRAKYVATYDYPVQVSGVIYDFQVVSINDAMLYNQDPEAEVYNFVTNKQDKNSGLYNRFGETSQRFTIDGLISNPWDATHLLPLTTGSSLAYDNSGVLIGGHTIGFTVKTISNLNGENDIVDVTPSYRYISKDRVEKEVNVYFTVGTGPYTSIYDDTYNRTSYIGSPYFTDCHFDYGIFDPVSFTADYYNTSTNDILYRETESHNAGKILLHSTQKLLTGNEEELRANKDNNPDVALRYNDGLEYLTTDTTKRFHASMQTWYGQYTIPNNMFVCEKYEDGTDAYQRELEEKGFVTDSSDIWLNDGYLVLGFDIVTLKNGTVKDLRYVGGKLNMWQIETGDEENTSVTYYEPVSKEHITTTIPLKDGDVAVIDLSRKLSDNYSIGILYLN